jgi:hypothetical protein
MAIYPRKNLIPGAIHLLPAFIFSEKIVTISEIIAHLQPKHLRTTPQVGAPSPLCLLLGNIYHKMEDWNLKFSSPNLLPLLAVRLQLY